jgi:hypothetical protein
VKRFYPKSDSCSGSVLVCVGPASDCARESVVHACIYEPLTSDAWHDRRAILYRHFASAIHRRTHYLEFGYAHSFDAEVSIALSFACFEFNSGMFASVIELFEHNVNVYDYDEMIKIYGPLFDDDSDELYERDGSRFISHAAPNDPEMIFMMYARKVSGLPGLSDETPSAIVASYLFDEMEGEIDEWQKGVQL